MTLFCDPQSGSCDLIPYFKRYVVPRSLLISDILLPSADVMFVGDGPSNSMVRVGIEVKKLDDLLDCVITNRFTDEQLTKMVRDYDELWLLIVDEFKPEEQSGYLVKRKRTSNTGHGKRVARRRRNDGMWVPASYQRAREQKYSTLIKWLGTVQRYMHAAGYSFNIWHVRDEDEAAQWCYAQYLWYNEKGFDRHKAMKGFSSATMDRRIDRKVDRPRAPIFLPKDVKERARSVQAYDGIGYESAVAIARAFESDHAIRNASVEEIAKVRVGGKVLGKRKAESLFKRMRGLKELKGAKTK